MNTSSKPAFAPGPGHRVDAFPYTDVGNSALPASPALTGGVPTISLEEAALREQAIAESARREGAAQTRARFEEQIVQIRGEVSRALQEFTAERKSYYGRLETEVVQLALAIARKVLHRESQLDPLLLAGLVRVALDRIDCATKVTVRVHPVHAGDWRGHFARWMQPHEVPEVVEDPTLGPERCVLETGLGEAELGLEVQLKEIEQGLFDLLAERPERKK